MPDQAEAAPEVQEREPTEFEIARAERAERFADVDPVVVTSQPYRLDGRQITHGDFMRRWWRNRGRDPEHAPDADCEGLMEIRGERDPTDGVVRWYGDTEFIEVFCGDCSVLHGPSVAAMRTEVAMASRAAGGQSSRRDEPDW